MFNSAMSVDARIALPSVAVSTLPVVRLPKLVLPIIITVAVPGTA